MKRSIGRLILYLSGRDHAYVHRPTDPGASSGFLKRLLQKEMERSENLIRPSGIHRDYGILIGLGEHIKQGEGLAEASIMDLPRRYFTDQAYQYLLIWMGGYCLSF